MTQASDFAFRVELERGAGSLAKQLASYIRTCIIRGELSAGDRLPATRVLARDLSLARGTVTEAIERLVSEGLLEGRPGAGTFVSDAANLSVTPKISLSHDAVFELLAQPNPDIDERRTCQIDFRPCRPSVEAFPVQAWRRCLSLAASAPLESDYGDPLGDYALRQTLCEYLRRARGLSVDPESVLITNGSVHAMHLLSQIYLASSSKVFFEDPGYPLARQTFSLSGAEIIACPVDEDGLIVEALPETVAQNSLVYVTPSHQFPTGSRLSLQRRHDLITWATSNKAIIVEDDYDGEYRYDVPPLAPLRTLSPNTVVYCGTFSKTLFPGLRIGFAIAPKPVIKAMASYRALSEYTANTQTQNALKHFISHGHFERHILRMRRIYRKKRQRVVDCLQRANRPAKVTGLESGLNVLIEFDGDISAENLQEFAASEGILFQGLSRYFSSGATVSNSIVMGYAAPSLDEIEHGLDVLFRLLLR